jgi:hypothetical protein
VWIAVKLWPMGTNYKVTRLSSLGMHFMCVLHKRWCGATRLRTFYLLIFEKKQQWLRTLNIFSLSKHKYLNKFTNININLIRIVKKTLITYHSNYASKKGIICWYLFIKILINTWVVWNSRFWPYTAPPRHHLYPLPALYYATELPPLPTSSHILR